MTAKKPKKFVSWAKNDDRNWNQGTQCAVTVLNLLWEDRMVTVVPTPNINVPDIEKMHAIFPQKSLSAESLSLALMGKFLNKKSYLICK
jgi:hypothetical protein